MDISKHIGTLVESGISINEIARIIGANRATVYRAWSGSGMRLATAVSIMAIKPLRKGGKK